MALAIAAILLACKDDDNDSVKKLRESILKAVRNSITNNFFGDFRETELYTSIVNIAKSTSSRAAAAGAAARSFDADNIIMTRRNRPTVRKTTWMADQSSDIHLRPKNISVTSHHTVEKRVFPMQRHDHFHMQKTVNKTVVDKTVNQVSREDTFVVNSAAIARLERRVAQLEAQLAGM